MGLTADRLTDQVGIEQALMRRFSVKAGVKIYAGGIVALLAGLALAGTGVTGLACVGRAEETVDNSGGADGDLTINVMSGIFRYDNSGTDPVTAADIGNDCYLVDDETVAKTGETAIAAETVGTGDGTAKTFNFTLAALTAKTGSLIVTDGTETFSDNGYGDLIGSAGGSGVLNYESGTGRVTFNAAPANAANISADYKQVIHSVAGKVFDLDADGVWVEFYK